MKALILAAGLGTRLRPITDSTPKPLLPLGGKPLLQYHFEALKKHGIKEILVNTHYLHEGVEEFIDNFLKLHQDLDIQTVYEEKLLGSAGTLAQNHNFFSSEKDFFVVYGDNLTNINYTKLLGFHQEHWRAIITLACYKEAHPEQKGLVVFDDQFLIQKFLEKPKNPPPGTHYVNGGIYVVNRRIFDFLYEGAPTPYDFGHHVFPVLLQKHQSVYAYLMDEFLLDIGNLESYNKAQELIKDIEI